MKNLVGKFITIHNMDGVFKVKSQTSYPRHVEIVAEKDNTRYCLARKFANFHVVKKIKESE